MVLGDQLAHQGHHAVDDLLLAVMAIGEKSVICDVYIMGVGPRAHDFAQHSEAAEAGIENKNGRTLAHGS